MEYAVRQKTPDVDDRQLTQAIAFLSSSYVQNLADKHGRRPLLIILPILATLATSSMIVACKSSSRVNVGSLLIGRYRAEHSE